MVSQLFKEVSRPEIEKVVANLYGRDTQIIDCTLMKGGVFNTTYLVQTDHDDTGLVLRVAPINQHLLFDFEKSMMSAEPLVYELLHEKNIPAPEVIHHDNTKAIIEREYIVFKYMRSVPLNDSAVPAAQKPALYQQLGEIIASLHDIESDRFGWKRPNDDLEMYATWGAFLQRFAHEIADKAEHHRLFSSDELKRFVNLFAKTTPFDQITQACLVHADLWEGNVLVSENNGQWTVVALIDVDKAIFGDRALEFAAPTMLNDDFLRGYGSRATNSPEAIFRRRAYNVLDGFMYAYIWFAQFGNMTRYASSKQRGLTSLSSIEASGLV